jgi:hypothetical protein
MLASVAIISESTGAVVAVESVLHASSTVQTWVSRFKNRKKIDKAKKKKKSVYICKILFTTSHLTITILSTHAWKTSELTAELAVLTILTSVLSVLTSVLPTELPTKLPTNLIIIGVLCIRILIIIGVLCIWILIIIGVLCIRILIIIGVRSSVLIRVLSIWVEHIIRHIIRILVLIVWISAVLIVSVLIVSVLIVSVLILRRVLAVLGRTIRAVIVWQVAVAVHVPVVFLGSGVVDRLVLWRLADNLILWLVGIFVNDWHYWVTARHK